MLKFITFMLLWDTYFWGSAHPMESSLKDNMGRGHRSHGACRPPYPTPVRNGWEEEAELREIYYSKDMQT